MRYLKSNAEPIVHFLKIDAEGSEYLILKNFDLQRFRPWVIVAEATIPMSEAEQTQDVGSLILDNGYKFVYFDGLNKFYLAEEHVELEAHFNKPPNVFDRIVLASPLVLTEMTRRVSRELESNQRVSEARAEAQANWAKVEEARQSISSVRC